VTSTSPGRGIAKRAGDSHLFAFIPRGMLKMPWTRWTAACMMEEISGCRWQSMAVPGIKGSRAEEDSVEEVVVVVEAAVGHEAGLEVTEDHEVGLAEIEDHEAGLAEIEDHEAGLAEIEDLEADLVEIEDLVAVLVTPRSFAINPDQNLRIDEVQIVLDPNRKKTSLVIGGLARETSQNLEADLEMTSCRTVNVCWTMEMHLYIYDSITV